jgi:hypothetical protein
LLQVKIVFMVRILRGTATLPHRIFLEVYVPDLAAGVSQDPTVPSYARHIARRFWRYEPGGAIDCNDRAFMIRWDHIYDIKPIWLPPHEEGFRLQPQRIGDYVTKIFASLESDAPEAREINDMHQANDAAAAPVPDREREFGCWPPEHPQAE